MLSLVKNLFKKNPLQGLPSSLNALILTNESTRIIITGNMIYNPAYTYKFQLKTTNKWTRTNGFYFICFRPFSVNLIPHTNLIMIVADKTCPCFSTKISIEPTKVEYGPANETAYCERLKYSIYRRKPTHCLNYHAEVSFDIYQKICTVQF